MQASDGFASEPRSSLILMILSYIMRTWAIFCRKIPAVLLIVLKYRFWCRTLMLLLLSHAWSTQMWSSLLSYQWRCGDGLVAFACRSATGVCYVDSTWPKSIRSNRVKRTINNDCLSDSSFKLIYLINRKRYSTNIICLTVETHTYTHETQENIRINTY